MPFHSSQGLATEMPTSAARAACQRIPPLWPLQSFVAVNPFLGLTDRRFPDAARLIDAVGHGAMLMTAEYYRRECEAGGLGAEHIAAAYTDCTGMPAPRQPLLWLETELTRHEDSARVLTVADWIDHVRGTNWAEFVIDEISKWCSSYFDRAQCRWAMPWRDEPLYSAWKHAASRDLNPEVHGLPGFRAFVRALPDGEEAAIQQLLFLLDVPGEEAEDFLHRQLMSIFGWSAWCVFREGKPAGGNLTRQLLAIRLAYDAALLTVGEGYDASRKLSVPCSFTMPKYIAQVAAEAAFRSRLAAKLAAAPAEERSFARKRMQAAFCIDVRSEGYRRALEAQDDGIETIGFAGFFGMPLEFQDSALCPVLISPGYRIESETTGSGGSWWSETWSNLRTSASACFPSVETGGLGYGLAITKRLLGLPDQTVERPVLKWQIPLEARVRLVTDALRNMSLDARKLAPVVLFCGHGSRTQNNPYGSSLDCGACGGHKGEVNARFAAALMNDPEVRDELKRRHIAIPADTVFVAGLHVTTTNEVLLYETDLLTPEQYENLQGWLRNASEMLGTKGEQRSRDWSEVRPEWGLAGNAAFIAATRSRTRSLDLGGRVFLHDYDAALDTDGSVLSLILTAPVVVASWINLQYYGSTVNNKLFGSGNKALHNVVGTFGIWEGNAGDLRTGLPMQSLHDGDKWMHEPLRLQVFVEAPRARIDNVLAAQPKVRELVENEWIHLIAMEGRAFYERKAEENWRRMSE
ncbi:MAG TPA: DUF2309 domain-containing protein [Bryobacteraceae bacterium]|nr:DUF2309 domain-containing protein [Bryobacteraceae bacterium]